MDDVFDPGQRAAVEHAWIQQHAPDPRPLGARAADTQQRQALVVVGLALSLVVLVVALCVLVAVPRTRPGPGLQTASAVLNLVALVPILAGMVVLLRGTRNRAALGPPPVLVLPRPLRRAIVRQATGRAPVEPAYEPFVQTVAFRFVQQQASLRPGLPLVLLGVLLVNTAQSVMNWRQLVVVALVGAVYVWTTVVTTRRLRGARRVLDGASVRV